MSDSTIGKLMESSSVRNLGLKEEIISRIIKSYSDILLRTLMENGHIELDNGMNIEIVRLIDRVHVLRGVSYHSNRKYKLKLTMEDHLYQDIENYYDELQKEID